MTPKAIKVACSNCNLRELCMPVDLDDSDMDKIDTLVATRRKIKRGDALFSNGDRFDALYAIRTGFFLNSFAMGASMLTSSTAAAPSETGQVEYMRRGSAM